MTSVRFAIINTNNAVILHLTIYMSKEARYLQLDLGKHGRVEAFERGSRY